MDLTKEDREIIIRGLFTLLNNFDDHDMEELSFLDGDYQKAEDSILRLVKKVDTGK